MCVCVCVCVCVLINIMFMLSSFYFKEPVTYNLNYN